MRCAHREVVTSSKRVRLQELLDGAVLKPEIKGGRATSLSDALHLRSADLTRRLMKEGSKFLKKFVRNPEFRSLIEDTCRINQEEEEQVWLQKVEDYVVAYYEALMKYRIRQYEEGREDETGDGIRYPGKEKDKILFLSLCRNFNFKSTFPLTPKAGRKEVRNNALKMIPLFTTWGCINSSRFPRVLPNGTLNKILHLGEKVFEESDIGSADINFSGEQEFLELLSSPPVSMTRRSRGFQLCKLNPTSIAEYQALWRSHILDQARGGLYNFTHDTTDDNWLYWDTQNRGEGTCNVLRVNETLLNGQSSVVNLGLYSLRDTSSYQRGRSRELRPQDIVLLRLISEDEGNACRYFDSVEQMETKCCWGLVKKASENDWSVLVDESRLVEHVVYVAAIMKPVASAVMFFRELDTVDAASGMDREVMLSLLQPELKHPSMFRLPRNHVWPGEQVQLTMDWVNSRFSGLTSGQQKLCNIFMRYLCFPDTRANIGSTRIITVQGPPGCGKTEAIVRTLECMLHIQTFKPKILVCAPSNAATDGLAKAILQMLNYPKCRCRSHYWKPAKAVRLSTTSSMDRDVQEISIDRMVSATNDGGLLFSGISSRERLWRRKILRLRDGEVQIYISTLGSVRQRLMKESGVEFDGVIVDEAGQCRELDVLHALVPTSQRRSPPPFVILVGDPQQLPATVSWAVDETERDIWGRSMLERIMDARQCIQKDTILLDEQFRMHPAISSFPNASFYHGKIRNSQLVRTSSLYMKEYHFDKEGRFGPLTFVDTSRIYAFEQTNDISKSNEAEAELVLKLVETLILLYRPSSKHSGRVAVISPYRGQVNQIRRMIQRSEVLRYEEVGVETVDSMQGAERDVVFLSLVRSNINQDVGFVKDIRRLNVAMTRAKYSLIILGNSETLKRSEDWKRCIKFVKESSQDNPDFKFIELRENRNIGYLKSFLPECFRERTLTEQPI